MTQEYYLGIDISTTAAKALLIDAAGVVIQVASTPISLSTPRPLWSEQDPELWWQAVVQSLQQVLAHSSCSAADIKAIGLTGQMHGLVCVDKTGTVLRPAMLWNDQRSGEQCDQIRSIVGKQRLIDITGNDALTGFTAPKLLWVQTHEPDVYARIDQILLPKDYIRYRLSGEYATDKAGAAGTLLLDVRSRDWSADILQALDLPAAWFPRTYEGTAVTGTISKQAAAETGLQVGTAVVAGGGDQAAGAVGVGAVQPGILSLVLGTSGVVFAPTDQPFIEPDGLLHAFCHAVPDSWHLMGVMLSAAGSLQWFHDTLAPETPFEQLLAAAGEISPGAEGLIFLPYLTGERTPHPDPYARAGFIGLTRAHTRAHMTRALLEGVAYGLRDIVSLIRQAGLRDIQQVRISGGGARSQAWCQIVADVLELELVTVNTTEGAAYGAALLAAVGLGNWSSVEQACAAVIETGKTIVLQAGNAKVYGALYPLYRNLYHALKPTTIALAEYYQM